MSEQDKSAITPNAFTGQSPDVASSRRRRLMTGTAAGAGVFMVMYARSALSTTCQSPSAMISGNQSPREGDGTVCSGGRSPGFWKQPQHFGYWRELVPPTFKVTVSACMTGLKGLTPCDLATRGTPVNTLLPGGSTDGNIGVWEVLAWPTNYPVYSDSACENQNKFASDPFEGRGQLMRVLIVAYLNALFFTGSGQDYPIQASEVIKMWEAVGPGGSGIYCPSSLIDCGAKGMTASDIISFIQNLYGVNADVENDLCKRS